MKLAGLSYTTYYFDLFIKLFNFFFFKYCISSGQWNKTVKMMEMMKMIMHLNQNQMMNKKLNMKT